MYQSKSSQNRQIISLDLDKRRKNKNATLRYSKKLKLSHTYAEFCHRSEGHNSAKKSVYNVVSEKIESSSVVKNKNACLRYSKSHRKHSLDVKTRTTLRSSGPQSASKIGVHNVCMKNKNPVLKYSCKMVKSNPKQDLLCPINEQCSTESASKRFNGSLGPTLNTAIQKKSSQVVSKNIENENICSLYAKHKHHKDHDMTGQKNENHLKENFGRIDTEIQHDCSHSKNIQTDYRCGRQSIIPKPNAGQLRKDRRLNVNNGKKNKYEWSLLGNENGFKSWSGNKQENTDTQTNTVFQEGGCISWNANKKQHVPMHKPFPKDCISGICTGCGWRTVSLGSGIVKGKTDMYTDVPSNTDRNDLCLKKQNETEVSYENMLVKENKCTPEQDAKRKDGTSNCNSLNKIKDAVKDNPTVKRQMVCTEYLLVVVTRFTVEKLRQSLREVYSNLSNEKQLFCEDDRKGLKLRMLHKNPLYPV